MYNKNEVLEKNFTNQTDINETELKQYIYDLCEYKGLLDKRITNAFKRNGWLYNVSDKKDLKQDILLELMTKSLYTIPFKDKEDKLKLLNKTISNQISKHTRKKYHNTLLPLNDKMLVNSIYYEDKTDIENIMLLFADQSIERKIVDLMIEGKSNECIIDELDIGKTSFYKYKKKIKEQLKDNGYE